ncbi:triosephosphate isomerase [Synechococcus sp. PCC 7502]|uniref:triose-phosphate isomerase n=1 Tax=Synechococcus sp. PCC 7502 TaxID=1173263 RepID=UPI00029F88A6|nr:triose-phosphate isomerase [Synechococcus sp. PCC 7502]AFY74937.1 triosephosphate isomerase [Synechococcus sp. PCC 7502]
MRRIAIAGNWKMYKTQREAKEFFTDFLPLVQNRLETSEDQVLICAPYTNLPFLVSFVAHTPANLAIGAQNVHWADSGAFTGEISAPMLVELGLKFVIIGHSERRQFFGETDATVNQRLKSAQKHGITPILCVGETKQQRDQNQTEACIYAQLEHGLKDIDQNNLIIAYEPIWAIGTGDTCDTDEANRVIGLIRKQLQNPNVTIQYGGSVKPENIDEIMAQPEIDGVLVGGASLEPVSFARIVNYTAIAH